MGCIFIVSGFEKLIRPHENFLYVVQSYALLPEMLAVFVAQVFPWLELITGVFVLAGLWLKISLRILWGFTLIFILIVSQAILRNLPLNECGCFGELLSLPLHVVLLFDSCLLITIAFLTTSIKHTSRISLDNYFLKVN